MRLLPDCVCLAGIARVTGRCVISPPLFGPTALRPAEGFLLTPQSKSLHDTTTSFVCANNASTLLQSRGTPQRTWRRWTSR